MWIDRSIDHRLPQQTILTRFSFQKLNDNLRREAEGGHEAAGSSGGGPSLYLDNWTLDDLVSQCPSLDLVVDLTNTDRYYKGNRLRELTENRTMYKKIYTQGHEVPKRAVVREFSDAVKSAISRNPGKSKI